MKLYNKPFKMYASCIIVKGINRSIISDLQKKKYFFIPNSLNNILVQYEGLTLNKIYANFNKDDQLQLEEYFDFLVENDLIFFTNQPENFPKLDYKWSSASTITNAIIDIAESFESINYIDIINQLSLLGCQAVQIRCYVVLPEYFLLNLLSNSFWEGINDIQLVMKYDENQQNLCYHLYSSNPIISTISMHSSPYNGLKKLTENEMYNVNHTSFQLNNSSHCGIITPSLFVNNINLFTEAINFNSCLNRKIGIDVNGEIKNCPTLNKSFGNVKSQKIIDIVQSDDFKSIWGITKDQIEDCNVCEFRYMCTDCRAGVDGVNNLYKKPIQCKYDPYSSKWL